MKKKDVSNLAGPDLQEGSCHECDDLTKYFIDDYLIWCCSEKCRLKIEESLEGK